MVPFLVTYKNLLLQNTLCLSLTLFLTFVKIPIVFLYGLFTYIHPENLGQSNGPRAAIRRPSDTGSGLDGYQNLSSKSNIEVKKRNKSKEKFEFDENNAQIFRLKLDESHLQSRLYFTDYRNVFNYSFVAISCMLLRFYLDGSEGSGVLASGSFIPVLLGLLGVCKIFVSLAKVSFEKSASKRSDKQLSVVWGVLGFVLALLILFRVVPSVFDFNFGSVDGLGKFFVAVLLGCLAGFLFMPAGKSAKSFWLGTDQLRCNMPVISCGWFARMVLYANQLLIVFTALLWINPLAEILVKKNTCSSSSSSKGGARSCTMSEVRDAETLIGNVGMLEDDFTKFRLCCLFASGVLQLVALRSNIQMFLNEAVLSWYQRLHASKVPELEFSRAKVFLHNHFLCLAVVQFIAPPLLVLLSLGLSQMDGESFESFTSLINLVPCSSFIKEVALFMAWWVVFVSAVFTSANLVMYRQGTLYVS